MSERDVRLLPKAHLHLHFTGSMRHTTLVELAEKHAGLCPYRPFRQVDAHALHQGQVDDQAAVAH